MLSVLEKTIPYLDNGNQLRQAGRYPESILGHTEYIVALGMAHPFVEQHHFCTAPTAFLFVPFSSVFYLAWNTKLFTLHNFHVTNMGRREKCGCTVCT